MDLLLDEVKAVEQPFGSRTGAAAEDERAAAGARWEGARMTRLVFVEQPELPLGGLGRSDGVAGGDGAGVADCCSPP